jgi:hypothetical protein
MNYSKSPRMVWHLDNRPHNFSSQGWQREDPKGNIPAQAKSFEIRENSHTFWVYWRWKITFYRADPHHSFEIFAKRFFRDLVCPSISLHAQLP